MSHLIIYHTNDLHGNIDAIIKICSYLRRKHLDGEEFVYVDCGDFLGATGITSGLVDVLESAGLIAMVPGNHEFECSLSLFKDFLKRSNFPVIGGNISLDDRFLKSVVNRKSSDFNLNLVGVTTKEIDYTFINKEKNNVVCRDGIEFLKSQTFEENVGDLNIILSHMGLEEDLKAAKVLKWPDLIIGGHSHDTLYEPLYVNNIPVFQAEGYGKYLGRIVVEKGKKGFSFENELLSVNNLPLLSKDIEYINSLIEKDNKKSDKNIQFSEEIRGEKFAPNLFGRLASLAMATVTGAQIAYLQATAVNPTFTGKNFSSDVLSSVFSFNPELRKARVDLKTVSQIENKMKEDPYFFLHRYPVRLPEAEYLEVVTTDFIASGGMLGKTVYSFLKEQDFQPAGTTVIEVIEDFMEKNHSEVEKLVKDWMVTENQV